MVVDEILAQAVSHMDGTGTVPLDIDTALRYMWECIKANNLTGARSGAVTMTSAVIICLAAELPDGIGGAVQRIRDEFVKATQKHGPMHSAHEGYAIILEELEEYYDEDDDDKALKELAQTGAMAVRFLIDVTTDRAMAPDYQKCERCGHPVSLRGPHLSHPGGKVAHLHGNCPI